MGELEKEYGDRVVFNVVPAEETARVPHEIEEFGFTAQKHGLVAFTADGEPLVLMAGHQFGRDEIEAAVQRVLAGG